MFKSLQKIFKKEITIDDIHQLVQNNKISKLQYIERTKLVEYRNQYPNLLFDCVLNNNYELLAFLSSLSLYKFNMQDDTGLTPLHYAAFDGNSELVKLFIRRGVDLNIQNNEGYTALMGAVLNNHKEIVQILLEAKADINIADTDGTTALHFALIKGHMEIAKLILIDNFYVDVNIKNNDGWDALMIASKYGHIEIVEYLLCNRTIDVFNEVEGHSASDIAALNNHTAISELIKVHEDKAYKEMAEEREKELNW